MWDYGINEYDGLYSVYYTKNGAHEFLGRVNLVMVPALIESNERLIERRNTAST